MRWGLALLCGHIGGRLGRVQIADPAAGRLTTAVWHDEDPARHRAFVEASDEERFPADVGLPDQVLAAGRPAWVDVMDEGVSSEARELALATGLRIALELPILSDRGVEGLMEVLGPARVQVGEELLELFAQVGLQVGRVLERDRAHRQLREAERLAQLAPWSWDVQRDLLFCSPEIYLMHGVPPPANADGELRGGWVSRQRGMAILGPKEREKLAAFFRRLLETGGSDEVQYRIKRGRSLRWLAANAEAVETHEGRIVSVAGYTQDVTERKRTDERRRVAQRKLAYQQRVLEQIARGEPLARILDGLCRYVEREYPRVRCTVLILDRAGGVLRDGAGPSLPREYRNAIDGLPVGEGIAACGTAASRGELVVVQDIQEDPLTAAFLDIGNRFGLRSVWSHPLCKASGEVLGTFAVYRSQPHRPSRSEIRAVTDTGNLAALAIERSHAEAALKTAANFDPLTGLPNRTRFMELVNEELQKPRRRVTVMFLELDRFRQINDSLGHMAGDRIIAEVAERLRSVVDGEGLLSRFGGNEFTLMIPTADRRLVRRFADRILGSFEQPIELDGGEFFFTASLGIANSANRSPDAYALVRDADAAMYAARAEGPGRRHHYDRELRFQAIERLTRETQLRHAIDRDEIVMHYQPIMRLSDHAWSGAEALARWRHPDRGLIGPDEFIPLAEETGLIVPLGMRVLEMVIEQAREWAPILPGVHVTVNASVLQLARPRIAADILAMLEQADVVPEGLFVEVTESALMQELESTRLALESLSEAGVRVLIDDFGTGYSSLARLGELPITGLKIDRRFTAGLGEDPSVRPVVEAIVGLARAHGLLVVAEGIEDHQSLQAVDELGCHYAQGFHLGRPVPPDVAADLMSVLPAAPVR